MAKKEFQTESKRILDLMINSIYTHKEIFLRELLSNASDAVDKLAYKALTDDGVGLSRSDFKIHLSVDKEARTLTVSDNGIGMTAEELESNLGVIARSGSLQFKEEMAKAHGEEGENGDTDIIGQFGVGFYSAFMVADEITVITKPYGSDTAWRWQSSGADGYTIEPCEKDTVGTDIILHIKPDGEEEQYSQYLEQSRIQRLVKKYSDYIRYPITMEVEKERMKEKPADAPEDYKPEWETYTETDTLNSMVPLWQRPKKDVKQEEYDRFYQDKFGDYLSYQIVSLGMEQWQDTIVEILMKKLRQAAKDTGIKEVAVAGGVSANNGLRNAFREHAAKYGWKIFIPKFSYTTDNAAMIAITGYFKYLDQDFCGIDLPAYSRVTLK